MTKILQLDKIDSETKSNILIGRGGGIGRRRGLKIPKPPPNTNIRVCDMVTKEYRNNLIKKIRANVPELTYGQIGMLFPEDEKPLSRQRVYQIVTQRKKSGIIVDKMKNEKPKELIFKEPVSATHVAKTLNIPYSVISSWVSRGQVDVFKREGPAAPGKPVLLDPVSLQQRIDLYKPRRKKSQD